eukprot:TRINITY_DN11112_c0_g1_i5.p1 TRINITY_DN11112_c0_g1~~TRINITY_DN11112_c0_g1_i5.p1  ORF type:complete len:188 (-),score=25.51 TRINITY_DN11112_c0_g1_i5:45-608(-)
MSSRYYRAPELIVGATHYTTQIDLWSMGCVLAELLLGHPMFPGKSGANQFVEIIKALGTPSKKQLRQMNFACSELNLPKVGAHPWVTIFSPRTSPDGIDLVSKLLVYNPAERLKAEEVLAHPFFDELRDADTRLPSGNPLPKLFNFTPEKKNAAKSVIDRLIPNCHKKNCMTLDLSLIHISEPTRPY